MPNKDEKIISDVMNGILDSVNKERSEENLELRKKVVEILKADNLDNFFFVIQYPLEFVVKFALAELTGQRDSKKLDHLEFFIINFNYIENHFTNTICEVEGSSFSADKASYILKRIYKYLSEDKQEMSFIDEEGKKKYWHVSFWDKNNGQEWIEYFEALVDFHYGGKKKYLEFLKNNYSKLNDK